MKDTVKAGLFAAGSVIGAGFASGAEIAAHFGHYGWLGLVFGVGCGAAFMLCFMLFSALGASIKPTKVEDINTALFGKWGIVADAIILVKLLLVIGTMLGAADAVLRSGFGVQSVIPYAALATAPIIFVIVLRGLKGLVRLNAFITPIMIIVLCAVSLAFIFGAGSQPEPLEGGTVFAAIGSSLVYVCMNILLSFSVITCAAANLSRKQANRSSVMAGSLIGALLCVILVALFCGGSDAVNAEMPVMYMASQAGSALKIISTIVIWLALLTTLVGAVYTLSHWLESFTKSKYFSVAAVLLVGLIISMLGFSALVNIIMPITSVFGIVYIGAAVRYIKPQRAAAKSIARRAAAGLFR